MENAKVPRLIELVDPSQRATFFFGGSPSEVSSKGESVLIAQQVLGLVNASEALSRYYEYEIPSKNLDLGDPIYLSHESIVEEIEKFEPGEHLLKCGCLVIARGHDGSVCASTMDGQVLRISPGVVAANGVLVKGRREPISKDNLFLSDGTVKIWRSITDFLEESVRSR
jgi:hypothetical protein